MVVGPPLSAGTPTPRRVLNSRRRINGHDYPIRETALGKKGGGCRRSLRPAHPAQSPLRAAEMPASVRCRWKTSAVARAAGRDVRAPAGTRSPPRGSLPSAAGLLLEVRDQRLMGVGLP